MADVLIKGVPMDMGAGRRGVDMGTSAIRLAGLAPALERLGHTVTDCGNIDCPIVETLAHEQAHNYVNSIANACLDTKRWLCKCSPTQFPIVLGGDHSISMGTISGATSHGRTGVIWIDAHTDINTPESSSSGNVHGMPIAHLLGYGDSRLLKIIGDAPILQPEDIVYIAARSVDEPERALIRKLGIFALTMKDIDKVGSAAIAEQAITHLQHVDRVHVSFDVDALDPTIAPGVGTPVPGGLTFREAHLIMELLSDARIVTSLDILEVNPILDIRNQTAQIAVDLASSLLGKAIL